MVCFIFHSSTLVIRITKCPSGASFFIHLYTCFFCITKSLNGASIFIHLDFFFCITKSLNGASSFINLDLFFLHYRCSWSVCRWNRFYFCCAKWHHQMKPNPLLKRPDKRTIIASRGTSLTIS